MNIDITQIVVALIGLVSLVITSVIVPLMKSKLTSTQWQIVKTYALAGVQAAEILIGSGKGKEKLDWATQYIKEQCKTHGIKVDESTVRVAVENAWKALGLDKKEA